MNKKKLRESIKKSIKNIINSLPLIIGVVLLINIINNLIPKTIYTQLINKNTVLSLVISSVIGSIMAGNPITSYIIGGELLKEGISLLSVTAFIVAWVTVGILQLPVEINYLGKKFAISRNILAFIFSIIVAIITVIWVNLI